MRDASIEALTALAAAVADTTGGPLPGSTLGNPFLRVVFDCLAEQKKESQAAAGQALLQVRLLGLPFGGAEVCDSAAEAVWPANPTI